MTELLPDGVREALEAAPDETTEEAAYRVVAERDAALRRASDVYTALLKYQMQQNVCGRGGG
jgi:hypothetical protein